MSGRRGRAAGMAACWLAVSQLSPRAAPSRAASHPHLPCPAQSLTPAAAVKYALRKMRNQVAAEEKKKQKQAKLEAKKEAEGQAPVDAADVEAAVAAAAAGPSKGKGKKAAGKRGKAAAEAEAEGEDAPAAKKVKA